MSSYTIYPPVVDAHMPAFKAGNVPCRIYFRLSKFNSSTDFTSVHASIVKQNTGMSVVKTTNETRTIVDNEGKEKQIYIGRNTGIILNLYPHLVSKDDNLYYVEIEDKDLSSVSGSYSGWIPGWIYKIQLRLSNGDYDGSIGQAAWLNANASNFSEWSTICIIKVTGRIDYKIPLLLIDTREENKSTDVQSHTVYNSTLNLSGHFFREVDPSELIHSYQFTLYNENDVVLEASNEIYMNQYQDNDSFNYVMKTKLEDGQNYKLAFKYTTINGYEDGFYKWDEEASIDDRYTFICSEVTIEDDLHTTLLTIENDPNHILTEDITYRHLEEEEGRVAIKFYSPVTDPQSGNLCIRRSDSRSNFTRWDDIYIYVARAENINDIPIYYDYTIESGVWYKYGVQVIDKDGYRSRIEITSKPIMRNFNYSFLLGPNNQQLKLMFDNSMNNFKYQIADSNTDPIGSQYTHIDRNAATYYRVFPLNGLISFWMDENKLFCDKKVIYKYEDIVDLYNEYNEENNIVQYDYIYERDFRNKVLEFLQNGEFKLFKSPTEGNIIVRLKDVTCTPNQALDRMIYSFTGNAYEMAEANLENYLKYGFYDVGEAASDFSVYETKLGQLSMDLPVGTNIFAKIKEKYDSGNRNLGGYAMTLGQIHHVKITFEDKPFLVENSGGEDCVGNNFTLNGKLFTVYSPVRIYEFDERLVFNPSTDSLILYGDKEGLKSTVKVTIDFLYEIKKDTYQEKRIQTREIRNGIGQIFQECAPDENLFNEIYYKYYIEWKDDFQRLNSLNAIEIEANPGAAFAIQDSVDSEPQTHIIGATGTLRLYELENIVKLRYLGMQNPTTGTIAKVNTDVLLNYFYILSKGTYKKET